MARIGMRLNAVGLRQLALAGVGIVMASAGGSMALQGCSKPLDATSSQTADLSRYKQQTLFAHNAVIPVCWVKPNADAGIGTASIQAKEWVRLAIEKSYPTVTNLKFTGWSTCPPSSSVQWVTVNGNTTSQSGSCRGPVGDPYYTEGVNCLRDVTDPDMSSGLGIGSGNRPDIEYQAVHEFGHVLGYNHEQDQDAGYSDPNIQYVQNSQCAPSGTLSAQDAWVPSPLFPDGAWSYSDDLVTAYDPDSVMNYCHTYREFLAYGNGVSGYSGRLSSLDVAGLQIDYGTPTRTDSDGDLIPDYMDNCPYSSNGADQLDSNVDAELLVAQALNPSCSLGWCEDGHKPTSGDTQQYKDWWHNHYAGDVCDAAAVTGVSADRPWVTSTVETHLGCKDITLGNNGSITLNGSETCSVELNTQLTIDGHIGGPTAMAPPTPKNANPGAPTFCQCPLSTPIACHNSSTYKCYLANDQAYLYQAHISSGWQKISHEVLVGGYCATSSDCQPNQNCYAHTCYKAELFPELYIPHVDPAVGYDSNSLTQTWDFLADLATFGLTGCVGPCNDLKGVGWMHERNFPYSIVSRPEVGHYDQLQPVNLQNNYWLKTAHWDANVYSVGPNPSYMWQPVPYCNPGPKQEVEHEIDYLTVAKAGATPVYLGLSGSTLFDETANLTANAISLLGTLGSGNELLTASDRIGGQPASSTGYNAVVLNAGTPQIVGAIQDSATTMQMDGVFATAVVGNSTATLRTLSATNQALYWLSNAAGPWQMSTSLLSNAMSGVMATTTTNLAGTPLQAPQGVAYNRVTNSLFVVDWISLNGANAIRLLSVDITSGNVTALWTTSPFASSPAPSLYVSTTGDGEAIVSASSTLTTDIVMVNSVGRPLGSYTIAGTLLSAVVGRGDGITIPLKSNATGALNVQLAYVQRGALQYGVCNSALFVGIASPPGRGDLNGGFEFGSLLFWGSSGASETVVSSSHSGTYAAMLGSTTPTNGDSSITQTFVAPVGASALSFWYQMTCPDTLTFDWATATLTDNTVGGGPSTPLPKTCVTGGWTQVTTPVTSGHSYTLTLTSHDDNYGADPSYTLFDDIAFSGTLPTGALIDGADCQ